MNETILEFCYLLLMIISAISFPHPLKLLGSLNLNGICFVFMLVEDTIEFYLSLRSPIPEILEFFLTRLRVF